jgi:hypothetical protein
MSRFCELAVATIIHVANRDRKSGFLHDVSDAMLKAIVAAWHASAGAPLPGA